MKEPETKDSGAGVIGKDDLRRVGYDPTGETPRSGSFLLEDDTAGVEETRTEPLTMISMDEARAMEPWVRDLEFSVVDREASEHSRIVAAQEDPPGLFIHVREGERIEIPAQSCFLLKRNRYDQILHNLIVIEKGASLDVISGCTSASYKNEGRHISVTEIIVREGGSLTYTMVHDWSPEIEVFPVTGVLVEEGGTFISNYIVLTRVKKVVSDPLVHLGSRATGRLASIVYARSGSFLDLGGRLILSGEGSAGEILSRVVTEKSRVISRGYIEGAAKATRGHMECNGILLDEESSVHAVPELNATFQETELSHEAAVGRIAGEQIHYLMARGLSEEEARALIIRGFLDIKIKGLPAELQAVIGEMIEQATSGEAI